MLTRPNKTLNLPRYTPLALAICGALSAAYTNPVSAGIAPPPVPSVGPEFRVNSETIGDQFRPRVAVDADGDFVVIWEWQRC